MKVNFNVVVEPSDVERIKEMSELHEVALEDALNDLLEDALMVGAALERIRPDIEAQALYRPDEPDSRETVIPHNVAQFFAGSYVPETEGAAPQPAPSEGCSRKAFNLEQANAEIKRLNTALHGLDRTLKWWENNATAVIGRNCAELVDYDFRAPESIDKIFEAITEAIGHKEPNGYMYVYSAPIGPGVFVVKDISNYKGLTPILKQPYWLGNKEPV